MARTLAFVIACVLALCAPATAETPTETAVKALYERFVSAQNERDLDKVRKELWDSPDFLWISDGKPFWGADALIARMSAFQHAEIWFVTPDRSRGRVVEVGPDTVYLYLPLSLTLGPKADPQTIAFLVNVLCVRTPSGWRIAALFTTEENPK
jgi:ketosteroid isomerase-like protein